MKHDEPLVSIIITFYNEEKLLSRCLESVRNQTYNNLEVVLINDGSTDNSLQIAESFEVFFKNFKIITIDNSGPGNARNNGLANYTGEFVTFLDADDELEKNAIIKMQNEVLKTNVDLVMCMYKMIDKDLELIKQESWGYNNIISSTEAISLLVEGKFIPTVWGKLFKKTIADQVSFLNVFWKEDDVFMLKYLSKTKKVSIINEVCIKINCRNNSLTRQVISEKMINDIDKSFVVQGEIIKIIGNQKNKIDLLKNKINTFMNLFIIFKIDYSKIENKQNLINLFLEKVTQINKESKFQSIGLKKKMVLFFLMNSKKISFLVSFKLIECFKYRAYKSLLKIKS